MTRFLCSRERRLLAIIMDNEDGGKIFSDNRLHKYIADFRRGLMAVHATEGGGGAPDGPVSLAARCVRSKGLPPLIRLGHG